MKKLLIFVLVLALALSLGTIAFAGPIITNLAKINGVAINQNVIICDLTIYGKTDETAWFTFGDGCGIAIKSGTGHVQHTYATTGTYLLTVYMRDTIAYQISTDISSMKSTNQIYLSSLNANKLKVTVDCYETLLVGWGDGTSVTLSPGLNQSTWHDYAYPKKTNPYTITFNGNSVANVVVNSDKTSTFTIVSDWPVPKSTFIVDWITNNTPISMTNDWKIGSIVVLNLGTKIYQGTGPQYQITNIVVNTYWVAKVIDGPYTYNNTIWWKIQLADGSTGFVDPAQANPPSLF